MKYTQMHLDRNSHNLKYKYGEKFTPTEITYHQTANKAPAINERNYLNNRTDKMYIGFHIVVDDKEAIECLPLNVQSWHSGDGSNGTGNMKSIGVEIAYSAHIDINLRNRAIENGAAVIAKLMKDYNIPMSKVKSHHDRSGKNCPHDIRGRYGEQKFRDLIKKNYDNLIGSKPSEDNSNQQTSFKVGDKVKVKTTATHYATGESIKSFVRSSEYEVTKVNGNKLLLSSINSWVWDYDVEKASHAADTNSTSFKVKVVCDTLNIRQSDSFDSRIVGEVKRNEVFTIVKESNGLGKLKSDSGWISLNSKYVTKL